METRTITSTRRDWLEAAKSILLLTVERHGLLGSLCPRYVHAEPAERTTTLKRVVEINAELDTLVADCAAIESEHDIGCRALTNSSDRTLVVTVALLVAVRLSADAGYEARTIADVLALVGARDPEESLIVRNLFRSDGILFPFVNILPAETLDTSRIAITESAFNKALGLEPDASETITGYMAVTGSGGVSP